MWKFELLVFNVFICCVMIIDDLVLVEVWFQELYLDLKIIFFMNVIRGGLGGCNEVICVLVLIVVGVQQWFKIVEDLCILLVIF